MPLLNLDTKFLLNTNLLKYSTFYLILHSNLLNFNLSHFKCIVKVSVVRLLV